MVLKGFLFAALALCVSQVAALSLANSNWIWTDNGYMKVAPLVTRNFRRDFTSPPGKTAVSSQIQIDAYDNYTLFVNGEYIGQDYTDLTQQYCARLNPSFNVFAIAVERLPPDSVDPSSIGAVIAAIQINYSDGTSGTIVTDGQWVANNATAGFQSFRYNDAAWPKAYVIGRPGTNGVGVPTTPRGPGSLVFDRYSYWVWTNEVPPNSPTSAAPIGARAFRKTIDIGGGSTVRTGTIIIDADNEYDLYINGIYMGSHHDLTTAQKWKFTLDRPTDEIVIAVNATNDYSAGPAGLISAVAFDAIDCSCSSTVFYATDDTWKYAPNHNVPAGFEQPGFKDESWPNVVVAGRYGVPPWGKIPVGPAQNAN